MTIDAGSVSAFIIGGNVRLLLNGLFIPDNTSVDFKSKVNSGTVS